jgi:myo-inositol 2-dehydrogenase/D-chiro-inositol 1-dehydrogenase
MITIAILGAGRIGQVHAQAVNQVASATVTAVADAMPEAAEALAQRCDADVRSIDQIAESDDVDAVLICTPTDMHADLIEQFARAGKAIFCEKPIDLDVARARACVDIVHAEGATLMLGFQRRFDTDFKALKASIDAGHIGSVETVHLTSRDPSPPPLDYIRRSGGIFKDMAIHDLDVARWLLDEEIDSVQAVGSALVDSAIGEAGDFDTATLLLGTASGRQCTIACSRRASYGYDQRIEVHGSEGMISAQNTREARLEISSLAGTTQPPLLDFFMTRYAGAYTAEISAFVTAVKNRCAPPTTGEDGIAALVLAEAAHRAAHQRRLVMVEEITA